MDFVVYQLLYRHGRFYAYMRKYLADGQVVSHDLVSRDPLSTGWVTGTSSYYNHIMLSSLL